MSIKAIDSVWRYSHQSGDHLIVMLILADSADDHGEMFFDNFDWSAERARVTTEKFGDILSDLTESGELIWEDQRMQVLPLHFGPAAWHKQPKPTQRVGRPGYVYILRAETGHYKIGKSLNPEDRMKTFGIQLPFRVNYELVIHSLDYSQLEADLHRRYKHCRLDGEWFDLANMDIECLRLEFADSLFEVTP